MFASWIPRWLMDGCRRLRAAADRARSYRPRLELLEDRLVPATFTWTGAIGTLWSDPGNWGEHLVPSATDPEKNDVLKFPATGVLNFTSVNDIGNVNAAQMQILGNNFNISGGTIRLETNNLATSALFVQSTLCTLDSDLQLLTTSGDVVFDVTGANTIHVGGIISGAGGFVKQGTGNLVLTGSANNTYGGKTTVNAGVLEVAKPGALGATTAATIVNDPGTLQLGAGSSGGTEPLTLGGTGGSTNRGALNATGTTTTTWNADITLGSAVVFVRAGNSLSGGVLTFLTLNGRIGGGTNALTKVGRGTLAFAGAAANVYTGTTRVSEGSLTLAKTAGIDAISGPLIIGGDKSSVPELVPCSVVLSNNNQIADSSAITVSDGCTLDLATIGRSETIGPLNLHGGAITTGTGVLTLTSNVTATSTNFGRAKISGRLSFGGVTRTFTVDAGSNSPDLTVDAIITGTAGEGLTKAGAGEMTLSGANTYSGTTNVNGGTLNVNGDQPRSLVLVANGATLGGTGTIGTLKVNSGGTVAPGILSPLTVEGNATLFPNSVFLAGISGTTLGANLTVTGTLTLSGTILKISDTNALLSTRITFLNATTISGAFTNVANGGIAVSSSGRPYRVNYAKASGHIELISGPAFQNRAITSPISEGGVATLTGRITTILPDDLFFLEVNWSDGTRTETTRFAPNASREVALQHRYLDSGVYTADLLWRDQRGSFNTGHLTLTVLNVAPEVHAGVDALVALGGMFVSNGIFSDPGADTWTATVDYGDDSGVQTLFLNPAHRFTLQHRYLAAGVYTVTVTVRDDDGGVGAESFQAIVASPLSSGSLDLGFNDDARLGRVRR